jgi:membrane protein YdbS with pleckstrin-like domain
MATDQSRISDFLKDLHLFNTLDDNQIARIEQFFTLVDLSVEETFLTPDIQKPAFYIVYDGRVALSEQIKGGHTQSVMLVEGDFFGEEFLLVKHPHRITARTVTPVILLCAEKESFLKLLTEFPSVKNDLIQSIESQRIIDTHSFNWLDPDEVIYQVRRHHPVVLLLALALPMLAILFGFFLASLSWLYWSESWARNASLLFAAVVLGVGIGWMIWRWIDWGNDYFVVTNQRVVSLEVIIGLYESRNEAPMSTIQTTDVKTSFLGRIMGYGNVLITTLTTQLLIDSVSNPYQLAAIINEYRNRAKRNLQKADYNEMLYSVRRLIGDNQSLADEFDLSPIANPPSGAAKVPVVKSADQSAEVGFWSNYFGNVFKTRIEVGNTITYRKHWYVLLRKAGWSTLIILILLFLVLSFDIMYLQGGFQSTSPLLVNGSGFVLFFFILLPWWLYCYVDWRNDIYQVTERSIFDIERRPFGTESKKSAALENILSLEHDRIGFLGYLLNVGNVIINIGEAKLSFDDVYDPTRVQQDIFRRMQQVRSKKQQEEVNRERDRILKLLEIYHQQTTKDQPT